MKKKRIVITGGHLTPALAVIDELSARKNWQISFFGRKYAMEGDRTLSIEVEIMAGRELTFVPLAAGRFQRRFTRYTLPALLKIPLGFFQALYFSACLKPQVILSFGGYVSVPVVLAGWFLRIPVVTHEQTVTQGLATRINAFFAKKIAVSWPQSIREFPERKVVLTGNPLRKEVFKTDQKIWRVLHFEKELPFILITGGNQGSHVINRAVVSILPQLLKRANVFHQCGHLRSLGDFEKLEEARAQLPKNLRKRYHVKKYLFGEEMGTFLNQADLVISRAGANITTELAALGRPAVLIPIPWSSGGEQIENAQMLVDVGTAEILPQAKLSPQNLLHLINKMTANLDQYKKNAAQAKKLVKLDAAEKVADLIERVVENS